MEATKPMTRAQKMLSEALQEMAHQIVKGDIEEVARRINKKPNTVRAYAYAKDSIPKFETGKAVLDELRKVVIEREQSINKPVKP